MNQYEETAVGKYELYKYELVKQSAKADIDEFTKLTLKKDNTFQYNCRNKKIEGKWSAGDNGDWTWINFEYNGNHVEGQMMIDGIFFNSNKMPGLENLESIEFTKITD